MFSINATKIFIDSCIILGYLMIVKILFLTQNHAKIDDDYSFYAGMTNGLDTHHTNTNPVFGTFKVNNRLFCVSYFFFSFCEKILHAAI